MAVIVSTAQEMEELGKKVAKLTDSGLIFYLEGNLGAGKTTFVRGLVRGFGYMDHVRSPTYNLFEMYQVENQNICHMDLYRLKTPDEVVYFGVMDYFDGENICLIEWPEKGEGYLPKADVLCRFDFTENSDERVVEFEGLSHKGEVFTKKINLI